MRKLLWGIVVLFSAVSTASAQVDLTFKPDSTPGKETRAQTEMKMRQTLTIAGMEIETNVEQFLIQSFKVGERQTDGALPVTQKTDTMQMTFGLPGGLSYSFDSGNPNAETAVEPLKPVAEFLKQLNAAEMVTVYAPDGTIKEVKWMNGAFADPDPMFKEEVAPEVLKKQSQQELDRLPGKAVNKGESWSRTEQIVLGGGQKMELEQEYTYTGPGTVDGKPVEQISVKTKSVKLWMEPNPASPTSFKNSEVSVKDSGGTLSYDPAQHAITHGDTTLHLTGKLTLVFQGQELPTDIDLTISSKTSLQ